MDILYAEEIIACIHITKNNKTKVRIRRESIYMSKDLNPLAYFNACATVEGPNHSPIFLSSFIPILAILCIE